MSIQTIPALENMLSDMIAQKLLDEDREERWWEFYKSTDSQTAKFKPLSTVWPQFIKQIKYWKLND